MAKRMNHYNMVDMAKYKKAVATMPDWKPSLNDIHEALTTKYGVDISPYDTTGEEFMAYLIKKGAVAKHEPEPDENKPRRKPIEYHEKPKKKGYIARDVGQINELIGKLDAIIEEQGDETIFMEGAKAALDWVLGRDNPEIDDVFTEGR